jgi:acetolactate synthase-1/2/3 large subunit
VPANTGTWVSTCAAWKRAYPLRYTQQPDGPLKPQHVVERLSALTGGDAVIVAGVGQHQMHASQHYSFTKPRSWINSGGLGTMGFAVPAAMGAQIGRPGELVVAIDGDGCFQMTAQELATCAIEGLPIKVLIFNNGFLGMVRQWQELFYEERYSEVHLGTSIPDYVKLAEAYGCAGFRCEAPGDVDAVLEKALAVTDVPAVVDFRTHDVEGVFPMVPAGQPNDAIVLGPEFSAAEQAAATRREVP